MAVAWLIEKDVRASPQPQKTDTEKARTRAQSVSGGRRKTRIMEISLEPTLSREQQAVSLPLYCIS